MNCPVLRRLLVLPGVVSKTTYLQRQCKRAAKKHGVENIMACSFTRAAANELTGRLMLPDGQIGTLHALAYRALGHPKLTESKDVLKQWNEENPTLTRTPGALHDQSDDMQTTNEGDEAMRVYQSFRARRLDPSRCPRRIQLFVKKWEEFKTGHDALDFTDLIEQALDEVPVPPGDPTVMLVDEVQDLTTLEMDLVKRWATNVETAVLVGDPHQCLYSFKGCDPTAFLDIIEQSEHVRNLSQSYRVPKMVKNRAEQWANRLKHVAPEQYIERSYKPRENGAGKVIPLGSSYKNPEMILEEISRRPDETHMILASCGYMLRATLSTLKKGGWPYHNPYNRSRGDWNPLTSSGTTAARRLQCFLKPSEEGGLWTAPEFRNWFSLLSSRDVLERGAKRRVKLWEDRGDSLQHKNLNSLFQNGMDLARCIEGDLPFFKKALLDSKRQMMQYAFNMYERGGYGALSKKPTITVGTIHSVKGGESENVYVFPDLSESGMKSWTSQGKASVIRMFYVAFTRAKKRLFLCQPATSMHVEWS